MSQSENTTVEGSTGQGQPETLKRVMGPKLLLLFIVGDILGTGVYSLTGKVAGEVGGAGWLPIIIAFAVAMVSALSYVEMVTKYPQAAGAALYVHKAFGIHFLTFMVTFAVLASGLTSASTAARTVASNLVAGFGWEDPPMTAVTLMAVGFMVLLMLINLRSVKESLMLNVVLKKSLVLADRAKSFFISNMSHELRTPLSRLRVAGECASDLEVLRRAHRSGSTWARVRIDTADRARLDEDRVGLRQQFGVFGFHFAEDAHAVDGAARRQGEEREQEQRGVDSGFHR